MQASKPQKSVKIVTQSPVPSNQKALNSILNFMISQSNVNIVIPLFFFSVETFTVQVVLSFWNVDGASQVNLAVIQLSEIVLLA